MEETVVLDGKQKFLVVLAHLSYFFGGIGFIIAPLIIYLLWDKDEFVRFNAKQALVAHVVFSVMAVITGVLCLVLIGFMLIPIMAMLGVVLFVSSIVAAVKSYKGIYFRYPFIQYFVTLFD
ncbi:MAG: DUF4870 domain-containing protein [Negativicutes bacterium]